MKLVDFTGFEYKICWLFAIKPSDMRQRFEQQLSLQHSYRC
jgi:hypothetical protein